MDPAPADPPSVPSARFPRPDFPDTPAEIYLLCTQKIYLLCTQKIYLGPGPMVQARAHGPKNAKNRQQEYDFEEKLIYKSVFDKGSGAKFKLGTG